MEVKFFYPHIQKSHWPIFGCRLSFAASLACVVEFFFAKNATALWQSGMESEFRISFSWVSLRVVVRVAFIFGRYNANEKFTRCSLNKLPALNAACTTIKVEIGTLRCVHIQMKYIVLATGCLTSQLAGCNDNLYIKPCTLSLPNSVCYFLKILSFSKYISHVDDVVF